jgi:hypothetical protein
VDLMMKMCLETTKKELYEVGKMLLKNGYYEIGMDHFATA